MAPGAEEQEGNRCAFWGSLAPTLENYGECTDCRPFHDSSLGHRKSGFCYCPDSKLYGKLKPGFFMSQGKALQAGYRPPFNEMCH